MKKRLFAALFGIVLLQINSVGLANAASAADETWPTRPLRWLVGFAPGGTADVLTRIAADKLSKELSQVVVVENRPGASGAIALKLAAQAKGEDPFLITVPGPIIFPQPEPQIGSELSPVAMLARGPMIIVGPAQNTENTLEEVIEAAKVNPEDWSYATSGIGTSQHLAGELLNLIAGTKMLQVPYKGGGQAVADVVGAQLPLAVLGPTPVLPHIKSGALKAYAVTTADRLPSLPQVPTVQEAGIEDYDASQWFAAAISPGVSPQHIEMLNGLLTEIVQTPDFQAAVSAAGMMIDVGTPTQLNEFIQRDTEKWESVAERTGLMHNN